MTPVEIKALRQRLGLSQQALADEIGVSKRCIQYWEAGERKIPRMAKKRLEGMWVKDSLPDL